MLRLSDRMAEAVMIIGLLSMAYRLCRSNRMDQDYID
jgi:hypothetical protein